MIKPAQFAEPEREGPEFAAPEVHVPLQPEFAANARLWEVDNEAYHAERDHESSSTLKAFRASIPRYHRQYVLQDLPQEADTKYTMFGSALHTMLFEPELWDQRVIVAPEDMETEKGAVKKVFLKQHPGKCVVSLSEAQTIERAVAAIMANEEAFDLLTMPGRVEQAMQWVDPLTGVALKCRFDKLLDCGEILEIKTTHDPAVDEFLRTAVRLQYHCQSALYCEGAFQLLRFEVPIVHIVVGTGEIAEVALYRLDEEALELGRRLNRLALQELRDCRDTGCWNSRHGRRIETVSLPRYAFNQPLIW